MSHIVLSCQNPLIIEAVQSITKTVVSIPQGHPATRPRLPSLSSNIPTISSSQNVDGATIQITSGVSQASILNELGFAGLLEAASFLNVTKQRKLKNSKLVCEFLGFFIQ